MSNRRTSTHNTPSSSPLLPSPASFSRRREARKSFSDDPQIQQPSFQRNSQTFANSNNYADPSGLRRQSRPHIHDAQQALEKFRSMEKPKSASRPNAEMASPVSRREHEFPTDSRISNYAFGPAGSPSSPYIGLNSYPIPPSPNTLPSQAPDEIDSQNPDPYRPYSSKYKSAPSPKLEKSRREPHIPNPPYTHTRAVSASSTRLREIRGERAEREKERERESLEDPYRRGRSGSGGVSNENQLQRNPIPVFSDPMDEQRQYSQKYQNSGQKSRELTVVVPPWTTSTSSTAATLIDSSGRSPTYSTGNVEHGSYRTPQDSSFNDPYRPYSSPTHYPQQQYEQNQQIDKSSFEDLESEDASLPLAHSKRNPTGAGAEYNDGGGSKRKTKRTSKFIQTPETLPLVAGSDLRPIRTERPSSYLPQRPESALVSSTEPDSAAYRRTSKRASTLLPGATADPSLAGAALSSPQSAAVRNRHSATGSFESRQLMQKPADRNSVLIPNGYIDGDGRATHYRPEGLVGNEWDERRSRRNTLILSGKTVFVINDEISKEKNAARGDAAADSDDDNVELGSLKKEEKSKQGENEDDDDEEEFGKKRRKNAYCARCCRPRVCVFITFLILLTLTIVGYIVWPHQPGILYLTMDETPGGATLKTEGGADVSSPMLFTADWTANFRATSNSMIGWDLGAIDVQVTTGNKKIGSGSLRSPVPVEAHSRGVLVPIPLQISYEASSSSEAVAAAIRSACKNINILGPDGKTQARTPIPLTFRLKAKMGSGPVLNSFMDVFGLGRFEVSLDEQVACPKNSTAT